MNLQNSYYYNEQIKKYIIQFMAVFSGLQVSNDNGKNLSNIWIQYGSKDRVVAAFAAGNTQNKPVRLPSLSAYLMDVEMSPELRKGVNVTRASAFLPRGGLLPNDVKVVEQLMPVPFKLKLSLSIYTSNTNQHFEILEQILLLFDPMLQIQTSTELFDSGKISTIELTDIAFDEQYPAGQVNRIIESTMQFEVPIYLSAPSNYKQDIIMNINLRLGQLNTITANTELSSEQLVSLFNEQGIDYQSIINQLPVNQIG